ncbi:GTP cyclohydrolase II [Sneathiella litorea]|uniref:GTP cyclohydrolase-2 n=1 Tax=Sneathiella litorea TaxID=2606216 RepID=A0A6L8W5S6_9PROT|nr:GTP cyclohydrolase II [Sneathiella litorea]MZR29814.1 GTP cyclohydrolase II [Sneathiella litorea]
MSNNDKNELELRRLRAVDRAIADLRRGLSVIVTGEKEASIVLATEMAFDPELKTLAERSGAEPVLALTAHRANVLHIQPTGDDAIRLVIEEWMDAPLMRALADATHDLDQPFRGPFTRIKEGLPPTIPAAIKIAKLGRLLPSVVAASIELDQVEAISRKHDLSVVSLEDILAYEDSAALQLRAVASAKVPLQAAENTTFHAFRPKDGGIEHMAIVVGDPNRREPLLARLHSECFTGDLIGSLKCDCGEQLRGALKAISEEGGGVLLYLAQEGRGIGLINKLRAYNLQQQGFDTIDANERLGFDADERVFRPAAEMLKLLGFQKIRLMTNNPEKVEGLERHGIAITERVSHKFPSNTHNELYLATKKKRSGHYL